MSPAANAERHGLSSMRWIPASARGRVFAALLTVTLILSVALAIVGQPLVTPAAPLGIVSYEFAGNAERSAAMVASWDDAARLHAALSLGLDYLYLVLYPMTLALACAMVAGRLDAGSVLARLDVFLSWAVLASGLFDAIENYGLIRILLDGASDGWARLAFWCAGVKFALIGAALAAVVVSVFRPR